MSASPPTSVFFSQRVVVGVGDMAVSNQAGATISTYALGSCIGLLAYDPSAQAGGVLHIMLPNSALSPGKAHSHPYMFADTGVRGFFKALMGLGVHRKSMKLMMTGGASVIHEKDMFRIGSRNIEAVRAVLKEFQLKPIHEVTGGFNNRTVHLTLGKGIVTLKEPTGTQEFSLS